jgi:hypothetical protein
LRAEVAELRHKTEPSAKATLPPPRPDR